MLLVGLHQGWRGVLGVVAGEHNPVRRQHLRAACVQVFIGEGMPCNALTLQPLHQQKICRVVPAA